MDTDWVIDYLHNVQRIVRRIEELRSEGIGMSIISLAELHEGLIGSTDPQGDEGALRLFLDAVEVVSLDDETCRMFGQERARLRVPGPPPGDMDLLIGSTALRHRLTVLTNNRRDFERMAGLTIESVS